MTIGDGNLLAKAETIRELPRSGLDFAAGGRYRVPVSFLGAVCVATVLLLGQALPSALGARRYLDSVVAAAQIERDAKRPVQFGIPLRREWSCPGPRPINVLRALRPQNPPSAA